MAKPEIVLQMPEAAWNEISSTVEADLESGAIDESLKKDLRRALNAVRRSEMGAVVIEPQARQARVLSVGEGVEPYIIGHRRPDELGDEQIRARLAEYRKNHRRISSCEEFENFLHWLAVKYEYYPLYVSDAPLELHIF